MNPLKPILEIIAFSFFLALPSVLFAQDKAIDWINENAHELHSGSSSSDQDLRFLSKTLEGKTLVGLGEASHGTEEFYFQKRRFVKYLVSQDKYRLLALESPTTYVEPINNYIQTGEGDLRITLKSMGLYNSEEFYKLCQWLKSFNESRPPNDKAIIIGFDDEAYWSDPLTRDKNMAENFIKSHKQGNPKTILWSHNLHLAKDTTMAQYKAMGFHLKEQYADQYYVIGFDTYNGSVSVLNNGQLESHDFAGKENTFSALFGKASFEAFFVDFHKAPNPFLKMENSITNIYSNWQEPKPLPIVPGADFDGLIFIRETTASKGIK